MAGGYNGSLTREQFLFPEMRIVARLREDGFSEQEICQRVYDENLFQYPTEREIKSKCSACVKRVATIEKMPGIFGALCHGPLAEAKLAALIALMCASRLVAEFMVCVVGEKYRTLDFYLDKRDVNLFFIKLAQEDEGVASWSESTMNKIKTVLRHCLREAVMLRPAPSEELLPVFLPEAFQNDLKQAGYGAFLSAFGVWE